jgi:hypothetical protein
MKRRVVVPRPESEEEGDQGPALIDRLVYPTTWPSTYQTIRAARPGLEWINVSDLSFVKCETSGGLWAGWIPPNPAREAVDPDLYMAQLYRSQYGGGWDNFWADSRGRWISPQSNDIVADPLKLFVGARDGQKPLDIWAETYHRFTRPEYAYKYEGVSIDMTPGRLTWGDWDAYLDDRAWLDALTSFARAMNLAGVYWWENSWGAGPRNHGGATGYQLESWGTQSGAMAQYRLWGYLGTWETQLRFRDGSIGRFTSGIPTLTLSQRRESNLDVNPSLEWSSAEKLRWVRLGLAAAHLMDIGSVSLNRYKYAHHGLWDPHSEHTDEIELWTRLEPWSETEWRQGTRVVYRGAVLPDASVLQDSGLIGVRPMFDPIGGQRYTIWLNPNDQHTGTVDARSALLVRSGSLGGGVGRAGER